MLRILDELFSDPAGVLTIFLLAFPGRVLALSVHEFAHAWVANRCGDPTAKNLGRMTVNPLKHLDPLGTVLMLLVGFGWARPVPVNPRNYRNYRRDDLKVSLAGVTMNLIMFAVSMLALFAIFALALSRAPMNAAGDYSGAYFRMQLPRLGQMLQDGASSPYAADYFYWTEADGTYYAPVLSILQQLPYAGDVLIKPVFGQVAGWLYQMLGYFAVTNLILCLFNLIPVPPLDGYHVLNDLVLRRNLFANPRAAQICYIALFALSMSGALGRALGWVDTKVLAGCGSAFAAILRSMGLMA